MGGARRRERQESLNYSLAYGPAMPVQARLTMQYSVQNMYEKKNLLRIGLASAQNCLQFNNPFGEGYCSSGLMQRRGYLSMCLSVRGGDQWSCCKLSIVVAASPPRSRSLASSLLEQVSGLSAGRQSRPPSSITCRLSSAAMAGTTAAEKQARGREFEE